MTNTQNAIILLAFFVSLFLGIALRMYLLASIIYLLAVSFVFYQHIKHGNIL